MTIDLLIGQSDFLDENARKAASYYKNLSSGLTQMDSKEKNAYTQTEFTFGHILGDYYAKKYFGEQAVRMSKIWLRKSSLSIKKVCKRMIGCQKKPRRKLLKN
ncbi:hypothetical protein [Streptococcus sp. HF-1907]|uniref:hypothetical protein n=1 Tax=Streptococcus sp. HF-1907 TaxID=2785793 RepID=UPI002B4BC009|nr:hypothetical protein [Streptococcus sp. HF-1907]